MRIAAIDIGTNSVHMIVVQVHPDLSFEVIDREKDMVRLGAGGLDSGHLTDTAMSAALQVLAKYRRLAESHKVDEIVASATSAVREAENGGEFIATVARQTGIHVRVISGTEEARLIHQAAAYGVDLKNNSGVVIDIGGGSVEVTLGGAGRPQLARSFKMGVIRLTERFVKSDPLSKRDERQLDQAHQPRGGRLSRRDRLARLRPRHRHERHDPQPRRAGGRCQAVGRRPQSARERKGHPSASRATDRAWTWTVGCGFRASTRAARTCRSRASC